MSLFWLNCDCKMHCMKSALCRHGMVAQSSRWTNGLERFYCSKVSERQKEMMSRSLPKQMRLPGVEHVVVVASGRFFLGRTNDDWISNSQFSTNRERGSGQKYHVRWVTEDYYAMKHSINRLCSFSQSGSVFGSEGKRINTKDWIQCSHVLCIILE